MRWGPHTTKSLCAVQGSQITSRFPPCSAKGLLEVELPVPKIMVVAAEAEMGWVPWARGRVTLRVTTDPEVE